jgi:hypothetical protein
MNKRTDDLVARDVELSESTVTTRVETGREMELVTQDVSCIRYSVTQENQRIRELVVELIEQLYTGLGRV